MAQEWIVDRPDDFTLRLGNPSRHERRHIDIAVVGADRSVASYHLASVEARSTAELAVVGEVRAVAITWTSRRRRRRWETTIA